MTDKVQKIREEVKMVVDRRLYRLNDKYFDLNKEVDGFTNEIMDIINSLQEELASDGMGKELPKVWDRETLDEYAYQVAYDLSNDWMKETPTWDDVETACKLGAEWKEKQMMKGE